MPKKIRDPTHPDYIPKKVPKYPSAPKPAPEPEPEPEPQTNLAED